MFHPYMGTQKHSFLYSNGLSIALFFMFIFSIAGQFLMGFKEYNNMLTFYNAPTISIEDYIYTGHFLQATFENWESEFFQVSVYVILTIFLRQRGSSESKKLDHDGHDNETLPKPDSPWPVKRGGLILKIYSNSLSIALVLLFILSFMAHWYGSWKGFNTEQLLKHESLQAFIPYLGNSQFWFESFQNWQSEFFSVFMLIVLSIYLRQKGSSQSKAVNAPNSQTGE